MKKLLLILMMAIGAMAQVIDPPVITVQPVPDTVASGDSLIFTVSYSDCDSIQAWVTDSMWYSVIGDTMRIAWVSTPAYDGGAVHFIGYNAGGSTNSDTVGVVVVWFPQDTLCKKFQDKFQYFGCSSISDYTVNAGLTKYSAFAHNRSNFNTSSVMVYPATDWIDVGVYDFSKTSLVYDKALRNGQTVFLQSLFMPWNGNYPAWLDTLSAEETRSACSLYVMACGEHFPLSQKVQVMNEFTSSIKNGSCPFDTNNIFIKRIPNFWKAVYDWAHLAWPHADLSIGDNNNEIYGTTKTMNYLRCIDTMIATETYFQIADFQAHLKEFKTGPYRFDKFGKTVDVIYSKNKKVHVTEIDIRIDTTASDTAFNFQKQSKMWVAFVDVCLQKKINSITLWTPWDLLRWYASLYPSDNYASPWGEFNTSLNYWKKRRCWYELNNYFDRYVPIDSVKNSNFGELRFRVNYTCVNDTIDSFTVMIKLPKYDVLYGNSVKNNGMSIGLFDSSGTTPIIKNLSEYDKTKKNAIIHATLPVSPNNYATYMLRYEDSSIVYPNSRSALSNFVTAPDFSSPVELDGNLIDLDSTVILDSVYKRSNFTRDTCETGFYLQALDTCNIRSRVDNDAIECDTGSCIIVAKTLPYLPTTQRFASITRSNGSFAQVFLCGNTGRYASGACTTSYYRYLYQNSPGYADTMWHTFVCEWDRSHMRMYTDHSQYSDTIGNYRIPFSGGTTYMTFFSGLSNSAPAFGSISKYYLRNTIPSEAEARTTITMMAANDEMFEWSDIGIIINTQPENDTVLSGQQGVFTVGYTGDSVQIAWYKNGVFTGTYGDTLRITGSNGDSVQAVLWNAEDTVSSSVAYLTVYRLVIDSTEFGNGFSLLNKAGSMYPLSGWSVRVVKTVGDTLNATTGAQDEYGIRNIVPSEDLPSKKTKNPYIFIFSQDNVFAYYKLYLLGQLTANGGTIGISTSVGF